MRYANLSGRLVLVSTDGTEAVDVEKASGGLFGPDPQAVYESFPEFRKWADTADLTGGEPFRPEQLETPVPAPRQVFAIGLNYHGHAAEAGLPVPDEPILFTKWMSSLTGPVTTVQLPEGGKVDWEIELVAVIGKLAYQVPESEAWSHIAGLSTGQDISERDLQRRGPVPQFGLGKSLPGFSPVGPWVVTPDEFADPDDLQLGCSVNGETVQQGRTGDLIFSVPSLVAKLSANLPLLPGDLVFTGTPAGVGVVRTPPRFLRPGDELVSYVTGIGELRQQFTA
ncbi:fumarylacetoacetate hydrolase family protein [Amycolatopsis jejuensis]|uniref:fumarylacetoacetate hydrolase family protein n=1 Tax=Amycolatopsis jejuensis TaxID=330084 RepID=UPI0005242B8F|nr:fumarylacetoacetate hydrolase family protein [Amycolatopsis jejuensis]